MKIRLKNLYIIFTIIIINIFVLSGSVMAAEDDAAELSAYSYEYTKTTYTMSSYADAPQNISIIFSGKTATVILTDKSKLTGTYCFVELCDEAGRIIDSSLYRQRLTLNSDGQASVSWNLGSKLAEEGFYTIAVASRNYYWNIIPIYSNGNKVFFLGETVLGNKEIAFMSGLKDLNPEDYKRLPSLYYSSEDNKYPYYYVGDVMDDINDEADRLTNGLKTDSQKVKAIHDYICESYSYDYEYIEEMNSADAKYEYVSAPYWVYKRKKGVCAGYARLAQVMFAHLDIPCVLIDGTGDKNLGSNYGDINHEWIVCYVDGAWHEFDFCWDSTNKYYGRYENASMNKKSVSNGASFYLYYGIRSDIFGTTHYSVERDEYDRVDDMVVLKEPTKTVFYEGQKFETDIEVILSHTALNDTKIVGEETVSILPKKATEYQSVDYKLTFTGYDMNRVGEQEVTVSFDDEEYTYTIEVLHDPSTCSKDHSVIEEVPSQEVEESNTGFGSTTENTVSTDSSKENQEEKITDEVDTEETVKDETNEYDGADASKETSASKDTGSKKEAAPSTKANDKVELTITKKSYVGVTVKIGNGVYKITSDGAKKTATFVGIKNGKKVKKFTVVNNICYKGEIYNITSISANAFKGQSKMKVLTIKAKNLSKAGAKAFKGLSKKTVVKANKSLMKKMKKLGWKYSVKSL